ncbi:MAG TPA: OsmC family protein [Terriglobales bacterium]|nr:OsmC family protein [Terriglobales bacterium]
MAPTEALNREINGVAVDELARTVSEIKANSSMARFKFRIRNQWIDAAQNLSTVDMFFGAGHQRSRSKPFALRADQPPVLLGKDSAANPVEYLLHALAASLTTSMVYHAASRGIHLQEVESAVEANIDVRGFLNLDPNVRKGCQAIRVRFRIKADVPDAQLQELCQLGSRHSPVFDSLTNGVPILIATERM